MVKLELELIDKQKEKVRNVISRVPKNEEEVKRIFFKLEETLGFENVGLSPGSSYPDASYFFRGIEVFVEFECRSSDFQKHKHRKEDCDLIVCWEDDDGSLKIPVIELSTLSDNWIEAREKAIIRVIRHLISGKSVEKQQRELMDKFSFDIYDTLAHQLGETKDWIKRYYGRFINERTPECLGGSLECVKRDIELRDAAINSDFMRRAPAVICKDCNNREKCELGEEQNLGYIFVFSKIENKSRRIGIERIPIKDEKMLSYIKEMQYNPWKKIRYKR